MLFADRKPAEHGAVLIYPEGPLSDHAHPHAKQKNTESQNALVDKLKAQRSAGIRGAHVAKSEILHQDPHLAIFQPDGAHVCMLWHCSVWELG